MITETSVIPGKPIHLTAPSPSERRTVLARPMLSAYMNDQMLAAPITGSSAG